MPIKTFSKIHQMNKKPRANAERFINTPKNKQNEKNPINLTK